MYRDSYKVIVFSFFLICTAVSVCADEAAAQGDSVSPTVRAENEIVLQTDETMLPVQDETTRRAGGTSSVSMLFQLILALAVVCALIYGVLYFIRRSKRFTAADDPFLKNVASLSLAPNKTVYAVTLIDKAYLIGASDASLSLIAEITDKELIDAMNLHAAQTAGPKQNFSSFLHTFFPAAKPKEAEANLFDSFLTKQRERLQNSSVAQESKTPAEAENGSVEQRRERADLGNAEFNARRGTDNGMETGGAVFNTQRGNNDAESSRIRSDGSAAVNGRTGGFQQ